ncbi:MAG: dihydrolipoamide succinyltransferase, partial [Candidatus Rokubacteria bacterium]|nr:dihydrolipoamide succinyltransferase [Candidatus Rokubacteria bacterium]
MTTEIRVPSLGESVTEAVIARWFKQSGEAVRLDEPVLEIETEKAAMELAAEASGRLEILAPVGARVAVGAVVGRIAPAAAAPAPDAPPRREGTPAPPRAEDKPAAKPPREVPAPRREEVPATAPAAAAAAVAGPRPQPEPPAERPTAPEPRHLRVVEGDTERVPMTEIRRTIAARLV